ncbi:MAG: YciI family protein [Kordiimonas sp.]
MSLIETGNNIFILDVEYIVPLEEAEPFLEAHLEFINAQYEAGLFLASGPKVPRTGGVVLAQSNSRDKIEATLKNDPFVEHAVARYTVTEFHPRRTVEGL